MRQPAAAGENCCAARTPQTLSRAVPSEQTRSLDRKREAALPSSSEEERPCQRKSSERSHGPVDARVRRRARAAPQREGVFPSRSPPPHWKPRQEEVDLKKDYAFKRAQREGGVFDPVEVTGAPEKEPALTRDLNPFTETGAALRRARLRKKWAQIEEIRRDEPVIYGPVAGQQNPVLAIKAADDADDAPPEPEETTGGPSTILERRLHYERCGRVTGGRLVL